MDGGARLVDDLIEVVGAAYFQHVTLDDGASWGVKEGAPWVPDRLLVSLLRWVVLAKLIQYPT